MNRTMMRRALHLLTIAAMAGAVTPTTLFADTPASWLNGATGDWTDPTQWSTNPDYPNNNGAATYQATIDVPGSYAVRVGSDISVSSILLNSSGAILTLGAGTTITTPSLTLQAGTFLFGGILHDTTASLTGGSLNSISGTFDGVTLGTDLSFGTPGFILNYSQPGKILVTGFVPEPSSLPLLSLAGAVVLGLKRRHRYKN